jgi:hypothetical protein
VDSKLLRDALRLLNREQPAQVDVEIDGETVREIVELLQSYPISYSRKLTVLACSMLIYSAISKHLNLSGKDEGALSRSILNGDYLFGLYHRLAANRNEWKLLVHLSLFNKRIQLALVEGRNSQQALAAVLKSEIKSYLDRYSA